MSFQRLKREADALSDDQRRDLISYLMRKDARMAGKLSGRERSAEFMVWAQRPRPRVGLEEAGRDAIYED